VATVTLNRPEHLNAWNSQLSGELDTAMAWCEDSDEVRAIVLTGAGRCFCAGADLGGGGETFSGRRRDDDREDRTPRSLPFAMRTPVIAAINGHAVGVGATYPLACDVRLAATDAKIAFVFVRRGMLPELASHAILPRVVGMSRAAELLLSGKAITGTEAAEIGLVSQALPRDELLGAATELATDIAVNAAPVSVAMSKRLLWDGLTLSVDEMMRREHGPFAWAGDQPDAREGIESFLEKRTPDWKLAPSSDFPAELFPATFERLGPTGTPIEDDDEE
jgi:enoyl-CoA hydratase/carnithine racemase